jgi:hypothetical protein
MKIGFTGLLTLIFITLKLTGYITWSWVWVLSPIWISLILGLLMLTLIIWAEARKSPEQRSWEAWARR